MPSHSTVRVGIETVEGLLFASLFLFLLCCDKHDDFTHNSISCPRWAQNLAVAALGSSRGSFRLRRVRARLRELCHQVPPAAAAPFPIPLVVDRTLELEQHHQRSAGTSILRVSSCLYECFVGRIQRRQSQFPHGRRESRAG